MHTFTDALRMYNGGVSRVGTPILYMLSAGDYREIVQQRIAAGTANRKLNDPHEGQVYPGIIVGDWGGSANLQVWLDGDTSYWASSRSKYRGDEAPDPTMDNSSAAAYAPHGRWHYELDGEEIDSTIYATLAANVQLGNEERAIDRVVKTWEPDARGTWTVAP